MKAVYQKLAKNTDLGFNGLIAYFKPQDTPSRGGVRLKILELNSLLNVVKTLQQLENAFSREMRQDLILCRFSKCLPMASSGASI
jgi:hypothetical protein